MAMTKSSELQKSYDTYKVAHTQPSGYTHSSGSTRQVAAADVSVAAAAAAAGAAAAAAVAAATTARLANHVDHCEIHDITTVINTTYTLSSGTNSTRRGILA